jgi:hypothetical protein
MAKGRSKKSSGGGRYRSAISGKYVSAYYAKRHPKTTVKESK